MSRQSLPGVTATARGAEPRKSRLGAVPTSQAIEVTRLGRVQSRDHHVQAKIGIAFLGQQFDPRQDAVERAPAPDRVVGLGPGSIEAHLQVDRGHLEDSVDQVVVEQRAVGAHTGGDAVLVGIAEDVQEIVPEKTKLSPTEVHLKDPYPCQLVQQGPALVEIELAAPLCARNPADSSGRSWRLQASVISQVTLTGARRGCY